MTLINFKWQLHVDLWIMIQSDGMVYCPGAMEAAASEPVGAVDGRQHYFLVPYHDGGHDTMEVTASHLQLQGRWALIKTPALVLYSVVHISL